MGRPGIAPPDSSDSDPEETDEWVEAFEHLRLRQGHERAFRVLERLHQVFQGEATRVPRLRQSADVSSSPVRGQVAYPGELGVGERLRAGLRWNAAAMAQRACRRGNRGGYVSSYASAASRREGGFFHFWRRGEGGRPSNA